MLVCASECESVNKKLENSFVVLRFHCLTFALNAMHFIYSVHVLFNIIHTTLDNQEIEAMIISSCLESSQRDGGEGAGTLVSYLIFLHCLTLFFI